jgi:UDPglucose 6-dehydrogenase
MKITVVGTGYVGLVTGTCFAEAGNDVTCVDIDAVKVAHMQKGQVPIYEPGLEHLFKRNIKEGRISFTTNLKKSVEGTEVIFLALPTPSGEDGAADLSYVLGVAKDLGPMLKQYTIIVDKSTVPVGTAEKVRETIAKNTKTEFDVVSNPEFLREGHAVEDFQRPDRVVIGTSSVKARKVMDKLYRDFVKSGNPIHFMDERSAEMTKYAANAFLATKISFMNQIANLCEIVGAEVDEIRLGIGSDPRIGQQFLYAGIGYGGSCFPKDVMALQRTGTENGYTLGILEAVSEANAAQKQRLFDKIMQYYDGSIRDKTFALWGLAFKPGTDDIREAPALDIIKALTNKGAKVVAFDPEATENVKQHYGSNPKLSFAKTSYQALANADALVIATEWPEFRTANFPKIKSSLKTPVIFDGRNIYEPEEMQELGFYYESMGRAIVTGKGGKNV